MLRGLCNGTGSWVNHLAKAVITYNNTWHSAIEMTPSECLLSRSYPLTHIPWMDQNLSAWWRKGHPSFAPFTLHDRVLKREQLSGYLTRNKIIPKYSGPYEIVKVNANGVTYEVLIEGLPVRVHYAQLKPYIVLPKYLEGYGLGDLQNASDEDLMEVTEDQGAAYKEGYMTDESDSCVPSGTDTNTDNGCIDFLGGLSGGDVLGARLS